MQQQLLTVAVLSNTLVLDGTQRGLSELKLYGDSILVPNTILKYQHLLYGHSDHSSAAKGRAIKEKLLTSLVKSGLSDNMFWIVSPKRRHCQKLPKILSTFAGRLSTPMQLKEKGSVLKLFPETKMRLLREMRVNLVHEFCQNVLKEAYTQSIKIQTI
jgi:hypothetical protein